MLRLLRRAACVLGVLVFVQGGAVAQEVTGRITGRVDGIGREWFVTRQEAESRSDWSGVPGFQSVTHYGNARPDALSEPRDALVLSFNLVGDAGAPSASGVEIRLLVTGFSTAWMARSGEGARVSISDVEIEGDAMLVRGTFSARLGFSDSFGTRIDYARGRHVEGRFEATLDRQ